MKKQMTSSVLKNIFTSAILVSVLVIGSANAAERSKGKADQSELKYIGKLQEKPIFQLDVENALNETVYLTVEDEFGNVLYNSKFNEKNFSKKFQFDMNDDGLTAIKVVLSSKNMYKSQIFEISNVAKMVENVSVTKLD